MARPSKAFTGLPTLYMTKELLWICCGIAAAFVRDKSSPATKPCLSLTRRATCGKEVRMGHLTVFIRRAVLLSRRFQLFNGTAPQLRNVKTEQLCGYLASYMPCQVLRAPIPVEQRSFLPVLL